MAYLRFTRFFILIIALTANLSCSKSTNPDFYISEDQAAIEIEHILSNIQNPEIPNDTIDLIDFSGKHPDTNGSINFQPYINEAIDMLSKRGGGWLHISADQNINSWMRFTKTYLIDGPVFLQSNVGLLIDRSVRLFFPFNPDAYLPDGEGVLTRYEGTCIYSFSPLFRALNEENIVIKGNGTTGPLPVIDGDGERWQEWMWDGEQGRESKGLKASYQLLKDANNADLPLRERIYTDTENDFFRPEMMEFFLCKKVLVEDIKIENSPFWCIKPVFSESCQFRNLEFDARCVNNDGIDPESSKNILIENIIFGNHDDNVAIKAGRDKEGRDGVDISGTELEFIESEYIKNNRLTGPTENVVIRNCHFSGHHAICIGSEMSGGVRNVYAVDNYSVGEVNMGLFIKGSRLRGGIVENVYVNRLRLSHSKNEVVSIVPNYDKADQSPYPPLFRNIQIENVSSSSSGKGILIHGWPDMPVENILIKDCQFQSVKDNVLIIEQSKHIFLDNLLLNGESITNEYNTINEDILPPGKI